MLKTLQDLADRTVKSDELQVQVLGTIAIKPKESVRKQKFNSYLSTLDINLVYLIFLMY